MKVKTNTIIGTAIFGIPNGSKTWDIRIDQLKNLKTEEITYVSFHDPEKKTETRFSHKELVKKKIGQLPFDLTNEDKNLMGEKEFNGFLSAFENHFEIEN
jgi:hypothetical protein